MLPLLIESIISVYLGHEFDSFNLRCHFVALEAAQTEREGGRSMVQTGAGKECMHQSKLAEKAIYSIGFLAIELLNLAEVTKLCLSRTT